MDNERHSIVFVDDEEDIRSVYSRRLGEWYDVLAFESGAELLEAVDYLAPSLFLIDWLMPSMSGLELCRELRKLRRLDPVPIAFFTGIEPTIENMRTATEAGAQSFISKSTAPAFFIIQVRTLVDSYNRLSRYLRDREIILSVLKHDIANFLTGVTTGVAVLALEPSLRDQTRVVLRAARELQDLFLDLGESLNFHPRGQRSEAKMEPLEAVLGDLRGYLAQMPRNVEVAGETSSPIFCHRRSWGRALYYQIRFIDNHLPADRPLRLEIHRLAAGVSFAVEAPGCFEREWERAFSGEPTDREDDFSRHDLLFVEYVRNIVRRHHAHFSILEQRETTQLLTILPLPDAGETPSGASA
ncbi:MAG TPA: response regulator [bacterium]|nr:response regulator [bacterium]HPJ71207.1 response regulator [bacterium]HPQ65390.1 response regulator [bacterium]